MGIVNFVKGVFRRMISFQTIEQAEKIKTPLSPEMRQSLADWHDMYADRAYWLDKDVKSLSLPAFIASEIARQMVLELKVSITGKDADGQTQTEDGQTITNDRSVYLDTAFQKLLPALRLKLAQACAAGGMIIKPYVANGEICFDFTLDWDFYPIAFDATGRLYDVIIPDCHQEGDVTYTRLERLTTAGDDVVVRNKAYKSRDRAVLGREVPLTEVELWKDLEPEAVVRNATGQLFGWYKAAAASTKDPYSPMGASVFDKASSLIQEADKQYSRLLWEFEGGELAIDVDATTLKPRKDQNGYEMPRLKERLFRKVDVQKSGEDMYSVFSPTLRDASILNGLNSLLQRIEDLTGLSRGTLSDAQEQAKTATELKIGKQRSYVTIADNQKALEQCLRDVIRVMDVYCTCYNLCPGQGGYEVSFEWDDSIINDVSEQMQQYLTLLNQGLISKLEFRQWYFGETKVQAQEALEQVSAEQTVDFDSQFKFRDE